MLREFDHRGHHVQMSAHVDTGDWAFRVDGGSMETCKSPRKGRTKEDLYAEAEKAARAYVDALERVEERRREKSS